MPTNSPSIPVIAQTNAWTQEYEKAAGLPTSKQREASAQVEFFVKFLKQKGIKTGKVLDIGCGLGRNAFYLARAGYDVHAFDIVPSAVETTQKMANEAGLSVKTCLQSASESWKYEDGLFDAAIDICVFDNMVTAEMKKTYLEELFRVLKPGGYFCIFAILANDGYYAPLLEASDKKEDYILYDPQNKIWSSMLPGDVLKELLSERFNIVEERQIKKDAERMYDKDYERRLATLIVQKPR